jgi:tetratricopeptide (TPR) repeat protein
LKLVREGWLLEPDLDSLAERMRWVVGHPEEARTLGQAASAYVRKEWTWERAAAIAVDRLQDLLHRDQAAKVSKAELRARRAKPIELPATAKRAHLGEARELLRDHQWAAAWKAALEALRARPFHPEAFLLLAEIARATGERALAKCCAERARAMAPKWKPAQQFLKGPSKPAQAKVALAPLPASLLQPPKKPRLTVCLIAKNEERFIGQCLESVRRLADQIVVMDTGSTDWTRDIAQRFGAEVYSFPWQDDFSAARNAALERANGDWILMLDADEELLPESHDALLKAMGNPQALAFRLPMVDKGREAEGCHYVPRLFRNAPGLFYVGRVHEQIFSSIEVRRQEWGLESLLGTARLLHHGYAAEMVRGRKKGSRNLRLLQRAIEELPNEANLLMNLGLELARSGRTEEALGFYLEAFEAMAALPKEQVVPELKEALLTQLCARLLNLKQFDQIVSVLESRLARSTPLSASLHFTLGLAHLEFKQYKDAAEQMRQCLAKRDLLALYPINKEIRGAGPRHCLAVALAKLNQPAEAAQAFSAAVKEDPKSRLLRLDYAGFLGEQQRPVEALQLLHQLVGEMPDDPNAWLCGGQIALKQPGTFEFARDWTAEAIKLFPRHQTVLSQRAEALLLNQQWEQALVLWRVPSATKSPRQAAARLLCELLNGTVVPVSPTVEPVVSQEFLKWYRTLINARAAGMVNLLNERLPQLQAVLPSAARVLAQVMAEARRDIAA